MAEQKAKVVPGIPTAALDAIPDQNTRDVLKALVAAHDVRNGHSGSGDNRFVTAEEVGLVKGRSGLSNGGGNGGLPTGGSNIKPSDLARIISDLEAIVIESPLFKELGEGITLISAPDGLVAQFTALKDGVTNLTVKTDNNITQTNAIKVTLYDPNTGLAKAQALIGEINNVSVTSTSAVAQQTALVRASVNDPATGLVRAHANIASEKEARANNDNAIARAINTVWSAVGNNQALIQEGSEGVTNTTGAVATNWNQVQAAIRDPQTGNIISSAAVKVASDAAVSATGEMSGKYTVKIDLNGYVTGFGLMATANNSAPFSEFIVRADRFSIGSPQPLPSIGNPSGQQPRAPFIVTTTQTTLANGTILPPGVYMDQAFIANAVIGKANIGLAEVDTLRIRGQAVTIPVSINGSGAAFGNINSATWNQFGFVNSVNYPDDVDIVALVTWQAAAAGGAGSNTGVEVRCDGVQILYQNDSNLPGFSLSHTAQSKTRIAKGTHNFTIHFNNNLGNSYVLGNWALTLLGVMR